MIDIIKSVELFLLANTPCLLILALFLLAAIISMCISLAELKFNLLFIVCAIYTCSCIKILADILPVLMRRFT